MLLVNMLSPEYYAYMSHLAKKKCIPCEDKSVLPMVAEEAKKHLSEIPGWQFIENTTPLDEAKITRTFLFEDFNKAIAFVNKVANIAEAEGHHPDIHIFYNKVQIDLWTHSIKGLHENDFILAAKINEI